MALLAFAPSCARRITASTSCSRPVYSRFACCAAAAEEVVVAVVACARAGAGAVGVGEAGGVVLPAMSGAASAVVVMVVVLCCVWCMVCVCMGRGALWPLAPSCLFCVSCVGWVSVSVWGSGKGGEKKGGGRGWAGGQSTTDTEGE
jgi:hypothetical protein